MTNKVQEFPSQEQLVTFIVKEWGITTPKLIEALQSIPRDVFLPSGYNANVLTNNCVVMPGNYTLSDPGLVAYMVQALDLKETDTVLDIGSGSGYHAILMAALCQAVYGVEIITEGYENSIRVKKELGVENVFFYNHDGFDGLPDYAPYDAVNFACGPTKLPQAIFKQLKVGGRVIMPHNYSDKPLDEVPQQLVLGVKTSEDIGSDPEDPYKDSLQIEVLREVRFMPMSGKITQT